MRRVRTTSESPHDLDSLAGFERFYRAYYGYAWAVLARLGVPPALVDDAHQDLFVTAYRRRETFQRGRPVKPWLVGIARRVAFRYRRSQRRTDRKQSALLDVSGRERFVAASVDGRVEAGRFLQAFIDALDPDQREVFVLGELEGYSGPEIAERLGINLNTAYTRLRTVRGQLRRALAAVEERRVPEARIERGLALVLPQLSKPGWLAGPWAVLAKVKVGVVAGVLGASVVAAVVIGGVGRRDRDGADEVGADEAGAARRTASATSAVDVAPHAGSAAAGEVSPTAVSPEHVAAERRVPAVAAQPAPLASAEHAKAPARDGSGKLDTSAGQTEASTDLQREVEALAAAREALAAKRPAEALARLEAHAQAHPTGELAEARAALRIACLCAMGRREQARGEAAVLLRRHPGSVLAHHATTRCDEPDVASGSTSERHLP